ncbi:hypothetical protein ACPOL_6048 [Acidisarcina polymorpha]|uniref:Uncharacterized protein n=1 Tax=Acidisarcina polymorpha TaxID=2211140 RepID=A0A2Z5G7P6_9BACT|nr:hypothetical protein ACPOL_6048 [Acidisarcina polymorpha]
MQRESCGSDFIEKLLVGFHCGQDGQQFWNFRCRIHGYPGAAFVEDVMGLE